MQLIKACPICSSPNIGEFNGRANAKCGNCGSLERTRYLYMLMNRMGLLSPRASILHLAPESGLFLRLSKLSNAYRAMDFDPTQYSKWKPAVEYIDLCNIDETLTGSYDLIIHNHVLEHLPCSVSATLAGLRNHLNPGGTLLFSVPIRENANTTEDLDPKLSSDERHRRFGQWDHMRIFGSLDVIDVLTGVEENPVSMVDPLHCLSTHELANAYVPEFVFKISGASIFKIDA